MAVVVAQVLHRCTLNLKYLGSNPGLISSSPYLEITKNVVLRCNQTTNYENWNKCLLIGMIYPLFECSFKERMIFRSREPKFTGNLVNLAALSSIITIQLSRIDWNILRSLNQSILISLFV